MQVTRRASFGSDFVKYSFYFFSLRRIFWGLFGVEINHSREGIRLAFPFQGFFSAAHTCLVRSAISWVKWLATKTFLPQWWLRKRGIRYKWVLLYIAKGCTRLLYVRGCIELVFLSPSRLLFGWFITLGKQRWLLWMISETPTRIITARATPRKVAMNPRGIWTTSFLVHDSSWSLQVIRKEWTRLWDFPKKKRMDH